MNGTCDFRNNIIVISRLCVCPQVLVARNYSPLVFLILFAYLFSITFLYNIISFTLINLFVSIFLQSYVNNNLHMSTLYNSVDDNSVPRAIVGLSPNVISHNILTRKKPQIRNNLTLHFPQ